MTKRKDIGFGSVTKRFTYLGLNPKLDKNGLYVKKPLACDPTLYSPQNINDIYIVNRGSKLEPWRNKNILEEWSKNLGYRNQMVLDRNHITKISLGPAWHNIQKPVKPGSVRLNIGFGTGAQIMKIKNNSPGPGTYCKEHPFKVPYGPHSKLPLFERSGPCRFQTKERPWLIAPNRYNVIDYGSIEAKKDIVVSKRGPYDLFTGLRDDSTIKNHFGSGKKVSASTWPLSFPGSMESFSHRDHRTLGVMNKSGRGTAPRGRNTLTDLALCIKNPAEPGPASYALSKDGFSKVLIENIHGFNSSYILPRGYKKVGVYPSVGRYYVKDLYCIPGHGHKHVFLSKIGRTIGSYLPQQLNAF